MDRNEATTQMADTHAEIGQLRQKMRDLQRSIEPQEVEDYCFQTPEGAVSLSELFGDKDTLFVIHNMGQSCVYCTLWADGFNGVIDHLENRAGFVVSSPDEPAKQQVFKESRSWRFRMVSHQGSGFAEDMGYKGEMGWMPGVSVFRREGGKILRLSDTPFGPGDDYCSVWNLFELIPEGSDGWQPQYSY